MVTKQDIIRGPKGYSDSNKEAKEVRTKTRSRCHTEHKPTRNCHREHISDPVLPLHVIMDSIAARNKAQGDSMSTTLVQSNRKL